MNRSIRIEITACEEGEDETEVLNVLAPKKMPLT